MAKAPVVEEAQMHHAFKVAAVTGQTPDRDVALLHVLHGTGMTATELAQLEVADVLDERGDFRRQSDVRAAISFNGRARTVFWVNPKVRDALGAYFAARLKLGRGVTAWAFPVAMPGSAGSGLPDERRPTLRAHHTKNNRWQRVAVLRVPDAGHPQAARLGRHRGGWTNRRPAHVWGAPASQGPRPSPHSRSPWAVDPLRRTALCQGGPIDPGRIVAKGDLSRASEDQSDTLAA